MNNDEYHIILYYLGLNDVPSDNANFRPKIRKNFFFEKKSGQQEFVWFLKQSEATAPS